MNPHKHAYAIVTAVSRLHQAGYGRLRILCYVKEGLGVWRHRLFASDGFDRESESMTRLYSLPGRPIADGRDSRAIAAELVVQYPGLMAEAKGPPGDYAFWLRRLLLRHPGCVFEMEAPEHALVNGRQMDAPFFSKRPDHLFSVHFTKVLRDSLCPFSLSSHDSAWLNEVQGRAAAYDQGGLPIHRGGDVFTLARSLVS